MYMAPKIFLCVHSLPEYGSGKLWITIGGWADRLATAVTFVECHTVTRIFPIRRTTSTKPYMRAFLSKRFDTSREDLERHGLDDNRPKREPERLNEGIGQLLDLETSKVEQRYTTF